MVGSIERGHEEALMLGSRFMPAAQIESASKLRLALKSVSRFTMEDLCAISISRDASVGTLKIILHGPMNLSVHSEVSPIRIS
jgi:hypothetical protein